MTPQGQALLANARDILLRVDAMRARAQGWAKALNSNCRWSSIRCFPSPTWAPRCAACAQPTRRWRRASRCCRWARSPPCWTAATPWASSPASISATRASRCRRCPRCRWWRWSAPCAGRPRRRRADAGAGRAGRPCADRADRCLAVEPGPRFRRAVAADLPRQRPGHQARHDPGRPAGAGCRCGRPSATGRGPAAATAHQQPGAARSPSRPIWRIASTSRWDRRHGRSGKRCRRWPEPCCLEERRHARFIRYFGDSSYPGGNRNGARRRGARGNAPRCGRSAAPAARPSLQARDPRPGRAPPR